MVREILKMGHPILREEASLLSKDEVLSPEFESLLQDMHETMAQAGGIGLAAPQIGISKSLAIIELPQGDHQYDDESSELELTVFINPKIKILGEEEKGFWEGCLSVPGMRGFVQRPQHIEVEYFNENFKKQVIEAKGFLATVIQHELDHLHGVIYVDRIEDLRNFMYEDEFIRLQSNEE